jgi:hypothetical protein
MPLAGRRGLANAVPDDDGQLTLILTDQEAVAILGGPTESRSHRPMQRMLIDQLQGGGRHVTLSDRQLGQLIRLMAENGSGSFSDRLRQAFLRPIRELLRVRDNAGRISYSS